MLKITIKDIQDSPMQGIYQMYSKQRSHKSILSVRKMLIYCWINSKTKALIYADGRIFRDSAAYSWLLEQIEKRLEK